MKIKVIKCANLLEMKSISAHAGVRAAHWSLNYILVQNRNTILVDELIAIAYHFVPPAPIG